MGGREAGAPEGEEELAGETQTHFTESGTQGNMQHMNIVTPNSKYSTPHMDTAYNQEIFQQHTGHRTTT